jgi:hypothetical protein
MSKEEKERIISIRKIVQDNTEILKRKYGPKANKVIPLFHRRVQEHFAQKGVFLDRFD